MINGSITINSDQEINMYAGTIVGYGLGTIRNCYNKNCTVSVNYTNASGMGFLALAGGIIGESYGISKNCFNTGEITATVNSSKFSTTGCA